MRILLFKKNAMGVLVFFFWGLPPEEGGGYKKLTGNSFSPPPHLGP